MTLGALVFWSAWLLGRGETPDRRAVGTARRAQGEAERRFLRRLSHELSNIATVLQAGLGNLSAIASGEQPPGATMANARQQVERLARLARGLGTLARLDVEHLDRAPISLGDMLNEAIVMAQHAGDGAERAPAVALGDLPRRLAPLHGDRDLLVLAISQLVDNALTFSPPGTTVAVRARRKGRWVAIEVTDSGPGFTPDDLAYATEPLYRGRAVRGGAGLGLGLSLVERIAMVHGGRLELCGRPGPGATVILWLPLGAR